MWPLVTTPRIWMSLTRLLDWLQNDNCGFEYSLAQFYVFKVDFGLSCTEHLKRKGWLPLGRNKGSCLLSFSLKVVSRNRPCEEQSLFIKIFHCLFDIVIESIEAARTHWISLHTLWAIVFRWWMFTVSIIVLVTDVTVWGTDMAAKKESHRKQRG